MAEFTMPALGAAMEHGTLVEWRKRPGERIERGEVIAEIETEKGAVEVECFQTGIVESLLVEPGAKVLVGAPMAIIREEGAAPAPLPTPALAPASAGRVAASPLARRRAAELGVALESVSGTGPDGAVTVEDVERASGGPAVAPPPAQDGMRRAIGAAMARSKREIPHFYVRQLVDLDAAMRWLEETNRDRPLADRILPAALLLKATALALREVPALNAHWSGEAAPPLADVNLGVAIFLRGGGLVAPAIAAADRLPLVDLMRALKDLVDRARGDRLTSSELGSATITVTSLGERGADEVLPVIVPPQVAVIGFGRIAPRPMVAGGAVLARASVHATLAADHRAADGQLASRLLARLAALLAAPDTL